MSWSPYIDADVVHTLVNGPSKGVDRAPKGCSIADVPNRGGPAKRGRLGKR